MHNIAGRVSQMHSGLSIWWVEFILRFLFAARLRVQPLCNAKLLFLALSFVTLFSSSYGQVIFQMPPSHSNKRYQTVPDTSYIRSFTKVNVFEIYPGVYSTHFNFTTPGEQRTDYRLVANSSGYAGVYLNYKWLSLKYSWNLPGTELDKGVKFKYTSLGLRFGAKQMSFHPFYDSYNGLLIPTKKHSRNFGLFRDMQFTDGGLDMYYYTNAKRFSFKAADYFSTLQMKSAGCFFIMATTMWQKINWKSPSRDLIADSATFKLLSSDPQWLSLIGRIGYRYNFVFQKGKWSIAPALLMGSGVLREINTENTRLQPVYDIQGWLNTGYNGPNYYFYITTWWDNLQTNLFIKNLHQVNTNISLTAGFRFQSMKKKFLGIL